MREKMIEFIRKADKEDYESRTQDEHYEYMAGRLIANGIRLEENQATSDKASKWISVKDRLPEAHRLVLCRWTRGIGASYGLARYQHENDVWYVTNEGMPEVTHWAPLPEPPKEE